jgi:hypothetical protein
MRLAGGRSFDLSASRAMWTLVYAWAKAKGALDCLLQT